MSSSFQAHYPWTSRPLIANAAMAGFAGPDLAAGVSRAGGIGFIGVAKDMAKLDQQLTSAKYLLQDDKFEAASSSTLPVGVGFLLFAAPLDDAIAVIGCHRPAIVASVSVARRVALTCSPDVLIMQGSDAGGHGPLPGAGIVSLVPETRDALDKEGFSRIGIFAAGGITDGRGIAAALACGADGVVMGTRFLACKEIELPAEEYRKTILEARDGGVSTARATVFDELVGKSIWPSGYDGRAIIGASYKDFNMGIGIPEVREKYASAAQETHKGFGGEVRAAIWAGTGVGLVAEVKTAGKIENECRELARLCLEEAIKRLQRGSELRLVAQISR